MSKRNDPYSKFIHIGDVLETLVQSYRRKPQGQLSRIWDVWDEAVGPLISENAKPGAFKGTLLIVHVKSSTWLQELQFLKNEILEKVNSVIGERAVTEIRFKINQF